MSIALYTPKSGEKVIAYYLNSLGKDRHVMAIFAASKHIEVVDDDTLEAAAGEYDEESDCYYLPEGWYEVVESPSSEALYYPMECPPQWCVPLSAANSLPDLLRALKLMAAHHPTSPHIGLARAAIEKATGEEA